MVDGYHHFLIEHLSQGVQVVLDQPVRRICHTSEGVTMQTADGQLREADYVIITAPIGVLQRGEDEGVATAVLKPIAGRELPKEPIRGRSPAEPIY